VRNCFAGNQAISDAMDEGVRIAFAEDRAILAAVHRGFANQVTRNFGLEIDRAPTMFRRRIGEMIKAEKAHRAGA